MNWKEIDKKYPKAFDLFFRWFKGDPKAAMTKKEFLEVNDIVVMHGNLRELYDFFDELNILISVFTFGHGAFAYCISMPGSSKNEPDSLNYFNTLELMRRKVEIKAFKKAFEILEEKQ